jgi:hypothetical protein
MSSQELQLTVIQRALADAAALAERGDHDGSPAWDAALSSMAAEFKALKKKVDILYVVTALGAFAILAQPPASQAAIEFGTIKLPLSMLSRQAIAVLLAGAYEIFLSAAISAAMIRFSMQAILQRSAREGWEFLLSRYEAELLWTNILRVKSLGHTSPKGEVVVARIAQFSNFSIIIGHTALVLGGICAAGYAAILANSYFGIVLSGLALCGAVSALVACALSLFWKLPYRPPQPAHSEQQS